MRRNIPLCALLVLAAAVSVAAPAHAAVPPPLPAPLPVVCRIEPIDDLFRCGAPPAQGTANAPAAAAQAPAAGAPRERPAAAKPVRPTSVTPRFVPDLLLVRFRPGVSRVQVATLLARVHAELERTISELRITVVRVPPERLQEVRVALARSPWVATAQRDPLLTAFDTTPNDTFWPDQWGLRQLRMPQAWDVARGIPGVVIAVIDSGVDASHPDLRGSVLAGANLIGGATAADDEGHGTAVAGVIAARTDNRAGGAGVCWVCTLLPIKVLDSEGVGDTSSVARGIVRAVDLGARVINLSLGGPVSTDALAEAVAYAQQRGVVVVAAAGNGGVATPFYPAAYPGVISVAGSDPERRLYSWSNFGDWVSVAAPGCNVAPTLGGGFADFCGTSAATPIVSGLAALLLSMDPTATSAQILESVQRTAAPTPGVAVRYGAIQPPRALAALPATPARHSTVTFTGTLTPAVRSRSYERAVAAGPLVGSVTFSGARTLTLTIVAPDGVPLARRSGASPLRVAAPAGAGSFRFVVSGARAKARFALTVTHVAAT